MMGLLGGYGSDDDSDGAEAAPASSSSAGPKRKKVDYTKLPVSRPLAIDALSQEEEAPLKRAAELAGRAGLGLSLLASLPAPKVTLGKDHSSNGGGGRIDLSGIQRPSKKKPEVNVADLLRGPSHNDERDEVPQNLSGHKMFSSVHQADGPSLDDLEQMRKPMQFVKISADEMKDPDWYMKNQIAGGKVTKGQNVSEEVSMYEKNNWRTTTHANPSKRQKGKHQINWLATEAMDNEADMQDRGTIQKQTKSQTQMKYGW
ncbi:unnamed protein product [Polarella glacialis]|uniref:Uncharacterized protein n=1 Tax=Polarella glacialis TaxID=89957 RepID=A0A813JB41_POLGL|nr:unnamed protein product [Polarella glacialis]CAE8677990.1 unnamed protein product [Polarella glacialis]